MPDVDDRLSHPGPENGNFKDLTGERFGKLLILSYAGQSTSAQPKTLWRCKCDCGAEVTVLRSALTSRDPKRQIRACPACRLSRECVVCGTVFIPAASKVITCSPTCRQQRREEMLRASAAEWQRQNPDKVRKHQQTYRARRKADPQREKANLEYKRAWTKAHREQIRLKSRADILDPEKREKNRAYFRDYQRKLRQDPEKREIFNKATQEWRRKKALGELMQIGQKIKEKADEQSD
ncbi:MAG: hypothetical protein C0457_06295 [Polymorphum sp.]|nr:hypothetical protein [Polymorphum sp.]